MKNCLLFLDILRLLFLNLRHIASPVAKDTVNCCHPAAYFLIKPLNNQVIPAEITDLFYSLPMNTSGLGLYAAFSNLITKVSTN